MWLQPECQPKDRNHPPCFEARCHKVFSPAASFAPVADMILLAPTVLARVRYRYGLFWSYPTAINVSVSRQKIRVSANTVHFTSTMAVVKSIRTVGCAARGRSR